MSILALAAEEMVISSGILCVPTSICKLHKKSVIRNENSVPTFSFGGLNGEFTGNCVRTLSSSGCVLVTTSMSSSGMPLPCVLENGNPTYVSPLFESVV